MDEHKTNILVVDDDVSQADSLVILLRREGYQTHGVYSTEEALAFLRRKDVDLVITDLKLGNPDGIWLTEQIQRGYPEIVVLVITAYGTIETAVKAVKSGAFDYILKPVQPEQLRFTLERALQWRQMQCKVRELENRLQEWSGERHFLGHSPPIRRVVQMVERVAASDSSVLIYGESGTGKELIAQMIHEKSNRRDHPLVIVNCGALPDTLQESELFGHVRGAFTGALQAKKGLLEEADGGTLFLDEVGELSASAQVKLLRFLENGESRKVGDTQITRLDVRVLAATNRDLEQSVAEGSFRSDLYYRLNVIPIALPPLREIKEDIPLIARTFLEEFASKMGKQAPRLSAEVLGAFYEHHWPGNVRELRNLIERAVVVDEDDIITYADLPDQLKSIGFGVVEEGLKRKLPLREIEKRYILSMLAECGGNRRKTGAVLGITKATLWRKLKNYQSETRDDRLSRGV